MTESQAVGFEPDNSNAVAVLRRLVRTFLEGVPGKEKRVMAMVASLVFLPKQMRLEALASFHSFMKRSLNARVAGLGDEAFASLLSHFSPVPFSGFSFSGWNRGEVTLLLGITADVFLEMATERLPEVPDLSDDQFLAMVGDMFPASTLDPEEDREELAREYSENGQGDSLRPVSSPVPAASADENGKTKKKSRKKGSKK